ncbi:hypothetical protein HGRIS_000416 [Hohenbuehelia grisea]|uniref:DUF1989 domain-containing protein n=1 Tax=Hohenbuehelia grisea TaxID=104357 RepID=A0ABR3JQZ7_9AGAR
MSSAQGRLVEAAYQCLPGGPLDVDKSFYNSISDTASNGSRTLVDRFVLPIRSGKAWEVRKGDVCRIVAIEGAQVGDLNIWALNNPRERLWAARTRQLQSAHVSVYDRLWSNLPYLRPMVTITGDSLRDYGTDTDGARVHDLLGTRCDPYVNRMLSGVATGLNDKDQYFMKTCPARKGDYFEFFAETDILCALSTCPGGDLSKPMWGETANTEDMSDDPTLECWGWKFGVYRMVCLGSLDGASQTSRTRPTKATTR